MQRRLLPLDGLRGIAVVSVMIGHYIPLEWGWIGVELFFALSGYLITTILLAEREQQHFWKIFYTRRFTRLVPAYVTAILAAVLFLQVPWKHLWFYYVFPLANIPPISQYYRQLGGLVVMWSLSAEEQFYFIWPIQIRSFRKRTLVYILTSILIIEPIVRGLLTSYFNDPWKIYFSPPFRLDGLAAGSLLAIVLVRYPSHRSAISLSRAAIGVSVVLFVYVTIFLHWSQMSDSWQKNSFLFSILALLSVGVVSLLLHNPQGLLGKILSIKPLLFLGRISYGIYLYQLITLFSLRRLAEALGYHYHLGRIAVPAAITTIVAAWLSYRYIETPAQRWGRHVTGYLRDATIIVASQHRSEATFRIREPE